MLIRVLVITALSFILSGCFIVPPYQLQIEQGKQLSQTTIMKVLPGMTKTQVKYLLGTPNVSDPFNQNTWYYVYTNKLSSLAEAEKHLTVFFNSEGKVSMLEGDYPPPSDIEYQIYNSH